MMFAAPAIPPAPAGKPATPAPPAGPPRSPAAASPPAAPAQPAGEAAGRTMMFQTGNFKGSSPPPKIPQQAPSAGTATAVFSQPPASKPPAAKPAPGATMGFGQPPATAGATATTSTGAPRDAVRSTVPFGMPRPPAPPSAPMPPPAAEPPAEEPLPATGSGEEPATADAAPPPAMAEAEEAAPEPGTFDKAPPRGLIIGVAAGLALLLVIGAGLVAYRKLSRPAPAAAAVEALTAAQGDADKDSFASIATAESKARDAVEVAGPRARFPQATALLARVQIQWADALNDQAAQLADKGGDDGRVAQLQAQAKAKLKSAFDLLSPALKASKDSPDLQLAFADYYRAQRLPSSMNRYLTNVKDDPRAPLIQGMAAAQDEEGAARAIPLLKTAIAATPQSARIHYRLALAHLAAKDEASARGALHETLRLSPQHERARTVLDQLGPSTQGQK
jgi:hypothetical protein